MKLTFFGATETVTGSRFLLEARGKRVLVDCGLFQGVKALRRRNWEPFPVEPASLDAVVLTHAHLDHTGYLPVLVRGGFAGPVYCTPGTRDLCGLLLPDAGHLEEEGARDADQGGFSKHTPARPLFTARDAERSLEALRPVPFDTPIGLGDGLTARFHRAGHLIGAASVHVADGERTLVFSGDVGRPHDPLLRAPEPLGPADYLVVESTYGNRRHDPRDPAEALGEIIRRTVARGGVLLVPAFAVGRAQAVLHLIAKLRAAGQVPDVPVFLNSPMATDATRIYCAHVDEHRLSAEDCRRLCHVPQYVRSAKESAALVRRPGPMVVISASGMATGGRILHHLKTCVPEPANTVLFVGYQASGTRGETLLGGADRVKIHGEYVPVRAEVAQLAGLSAHADAPELVAWLRTAAAAPRRTLIVHGEPAAQDALRRTLADELGWAAEIPAFGASVELA